MNATGSMNVTLGAISVKAYGWGYTNEIRSKATFLSDKDGNMHIVLFGPVAEEVWAEVRDNSNYPEQTYNLKFLRNRSGSAPVQAMAITVFQNLSDPMLSKKAKNLAMLLKLKHQNSR